jgi:hypothetical protein
MMQSKRAGAARVFLAWKVTFALISLFLHQFIRPPRYSFACLLARQMSLSPQQTISILPLKSDGETGRRPSLPAAPSSNPTTFFYTYRYPWLAHSQSAYACHIYVSALQLSTSSLFRAGLTQSVDHEVGVFTSSHLWDGAMDILILRFVPV